MSSESPHTSFPGLRPVRRGQTRVGAFPGLGGARVSIPPVGVYVDPLSTLVVGFRPLHPWPGLRDQDQLEAFDAAHEDAGGRLPHEPGYQGRA